MNAQNPLIGAVNRAARELDNIGRADLAKQLRDATLPYSTPPADDVREALARLMDPEAWRDVQPHSEAFLDDAETQAKYEGFFWEGVRGRRAPSLDAADRILAGADFEVRPRGTGTDVAVEAAARALFERSGSSGWRGGWEKVSEATRTMLRADACAALEAAREARS